MHWKIVSMMLYSYFYAIWWTIPWEHRLKGKTNFISVSIEKKNRKLLVVIFSPIKATAGNLCVFIPKKNISLNLKFRWWWLYCNKNFISNFTCIIPLFRIIQNFVFKHFFIFSPLVCSTSRDLGSNSITVLKNHSFAKLPILEEL